MQQTLRAHSMSVTTGLCTRVAGTPQGRRVGCSVGSGHPVLAGIRALLVRRYQLVPVAVGSPLPRARRELPMWACPAAPLPGAITPAWSASLASSAALQSVRGQPTGAVRERSVALLSFATLMGLEWPGGPWLCHEGCYGASGTGGSGAAHGAHCPSFSSGVCNSAPSQGKER